jgi:hypothetical protein
LLAFGILLSEGWVRSRMCTALDGYVQSLILLRLPRELIGWIKQDSFRLSPELS